MFTMILEISLYVLTMILESSLYMLTMIMEISLFGLAWMSTKIYTCSRVGIVVALSSYDLIVNVEFSKRTFVCVVDINDPFPAVFIDNHI